MSPAAEPALRDAGHWVAGVARELGRAPWPVSAGVALAGLAVLLLGARGRRPVAVAGAAGIAAIGAGWLRSRIPVAPGVTASTLAAGAAIAGGGIAAVIPQVFPALAGALPGAAAADLLAAGDRRLEMVAAGAVLGAIAGLLLARWMAAGVAAGAGALAVAVGVAGAFHDTAVGRALTRHPVSLLAVAVVLGVAGAAFQAPRAWGRGAEGPPGRGPPAKAPGPVKGGAEDG